MSLWQRSAVLGLLPTSGFLFQRGHPGPRFQPDLLSVLAAEGSIHPRIGAGVPRAVAQHTIGSFGEGMRLILSDHAVDRYVQRCAPSVLPSEAWEILQSCLSHAQLLREKTPAGQHQWKVDTTEVRCILVTRPSTDPREKGQHHVVTVLAIEQPEPDAGDYTELLADVQRCLGALASAPRSPETRTKRRGLATEIHVLNQCLRIEKQKTEQAIQYAQVERERLRQEAVKQTREFQLAMQEQKTQRHQANCEAELVQLRQVCQVTIWGLMTGRVEEALAKLPPHLLKSSFWQAGETVCLSSCGKEAR